MMQIQQERDSVLKSLNQLQQKEQQARNRGGEEEEEEALTMQHLQVQP